jgi:membrane-associated phospholipid phosphatase
MLKRAFFPPAILAIILIGGGVPSGWADSAPPAPASSNFSGELTSDFKYLANNFEADAEDIVTAPLHLDAAGAMLTNPRFYLIVAGAGAAFGGSFALDQTMRSHLRSMGSSTADLLQNISYASVGASTALLYGYGLYSGDSRARQFALTAGEGAGIATLIDIGIKAGFGRLRPSQSSSHTAFFHGGQSFVSGDVTPMFALAAGVSEYYDNAWYISIPIYSLALLDGFGRMGHDAHWFSDVVGAALLGVGTTELFLYLHRQHEEHPWRFRIFPWRRP